MDARGAPPALAFGPFVLDRTRRQLLQDGQVLPLGSRAFVLLDVLVERWGQVVGRRELEARVWPGAVVDETSLRVHISALRKALGEGIGDARYIANVVGRGYSFVMPVVEHRVACAPAPTGPRRADPPAHNLPPLLTPVIGRSTAIECVAERVQAHRLVSILGPGGVGKTTVAIAAARQALGRHAGGVWFVDLARVVDPARVAQAVASTLGVAPDPGDPPAALLEALANRRSLIVLDNCEHVIDAAATLAERLLRGSRDLRILATSREALQVEGEWIHRLPALEVPRPSATDDLDRCRASPAVQLFVERASANSDGFVLSDANLDLVCRLCRGLDGMPLAIELAAARIDSLGLRGLADRPDEMLTLLTRGRRTALQRHRTLRALLDWGHALLTEVERVVLRRLSIFKSTFTLESAIAVLSIDELAALDITDGVTGLASKSFVCVDVSGDVASYRLLQTTRAYAAEKLANAEEGLQVSLSHARHLQAVAPGTGHDAGAVHRRTAPERWTS